MTPVAAPPILGRHVWSELMTSDPKAAEQFYTAVVGWTTTPFRDAPTPYTILKRQGDVGIGGVMQTPPGMNMPPFWAMYIGVPNLDEAVAKVKKLGGSEMSGVITVPTVGRLQMLKDPQGAAFYVLEPEPRGGGPEEDPQIGDASWLELMTTDWKGASTFYQELFNWQPSEAMDMGPGLGTYQMFNRGSRMIGGMMNKPAELAHVPPNWQIYFLVPDINEAVDRINASGGQVINGPLEVPGGDWVVNALDPQGAAFSLHAKKK